MNTAKIDVANMALMVLSAIAAFLLPFEVFLFSYAVLGPLHYLTEIGWLHQRGYFTNGKKDYYWLVVPCVILSALGITVMLRDKPIVQDIYKVLLSSLGAHGFNLIHAIIFMLFASSLAFVVLKDAVYKGIFIASSFLLGIVFMNEGPFIQLFGVFLPTLIHVFLFTGLFILYGALKNRSKTGYLSLGVFVACAVSFFVWQPQFNFYTVSKQAEQALISSGFIQLNKSIIEIFNIGQYTYDTVFKSNAGLGIMRFIAFAYTYHYLNWFSKTEVIKWHQVPRLQLVVVIILWGLSVMLYAIDYFIGLVALYFLSMLHVILEFPLNYRSMIGIAEESALLLGWKKPALAKKKHK